MDLAFLGLLLSAELAESPGVTPQRHWSAQRPLFCVWSQDFSPCASLYTSLYSFLWHFIAPWPSNVRASYGSLPPVLPFMSVTLQDLQAFSVCCSSPFPCCVTPFFSLTACWFYWKSRKPNTGMSETLKREYKYGLRVWMLLATGTKALISSEILGVTIYKIAFFLLTQFLFVCLIFRTGAECVHRKSKAKHGFEMVSYSTFRRRQPRLFSPRFLKWQA